MTTFKTTVSAKSTVNAELDVKKLIQAKKTLKEKLMVIKDLNDRFSAWESLGWRLFAIWDLFPW